MCLLAICLHAHEEYKLVLAANRDERYSRPTFTAGWWPDVPYLLGGRDGEAGGTWLGITKAGRIAALTNYWGGEKLLENAPSRGEIVGSYLTEQHASPQDFAVRLRQRAHLYNGFNLVFGTVDELFYFSNMRVPEQESEAAYGKEKASEDEPATEGGRGAYGGGPSGPVAVEHLSGGIYGLSNALLDTPWSKVTSVRAEVAECLADADGRGPEWLTEELLTMLGRIERPELQKDPSLPYEEKRRLAESTFRILFPRFGTLSTTVIIVDRSNKVHFTEFSYYPERRSEFVFTVDGGETGPGSET